MVFKKYFHSLKIGFHLICFFFKIKVQHICTKFNFKNMKKIVLFLILWVQVSWAQTPIVHFPFNGSISDATSTYAFAANQGAVTNFVNDRFGNSNSAYATPYNVNQVLTTSVPNLPQGNAARSISVWVKYGGDLDTTNSVAVVGYGSFASNQYCGVLHEFFNSRLQGIGFNNDPYGTTNAVPYIPNEAINEWNHIVLTFQGTNLKMFYNGKVVMDLPSVSWNTNGTQLKLNFNSILSSSSLYRLLFDDLKVYDVVLTESQIQQMYVNESPLNQTGLLGYFPFENNLNDYNFGSSNLTFGNNGQYNTGVSGNAVSFGGGNYHGTTNLSASFPSDNFTVSFWYNRTGNAANQFETALELFGSLYFRNGWQNGSYFDVGIATSGSSFTNVLTPVAPQNTWVHVAIVFKIVDGVRRICMYQDGTMKFSANTTVNQPMNKFNNVISVGTGTDASGNVMTSKNANNMRMDNLYLFGRALSQTEIMALRYQVPSSCPTGNVTLTTQAEVDALASCTTITGNLTINGGGNALNLAPLNNITSITGTLFITGISNNQTNIFPNLTTVGNGIAIQGNSFQQFGGFNSFITLTSGSLQFFSNSQLQTISGFNSLINLTSGNLGFVTNNNLETINAFSNLQTVNGLLIRNTKLINLNFLSSLQNNNGQLSIEGNSLLTNATFPNMVNHNFSNGTTGQRYLRIQNNPVLTTIGNINFNGSNNCESITINGSSINSIAPFGTNSFSVNGLVLLANNVLPNLNFLQHLNSCGAIQITGCAQISNLIGLENLTTITGQSSTLGLNITNNVNLSSLNGLNTTNVLLSNVPVSVNSNSNLTNINALSSIPVSGISSLTISSNGQLATCASTWLCDYVATSKPLTVTGNAVGCETVSVINSACAALSTSEFDFNEISLYPNPTNSVFNLEIPNEVVKQVEIYDLSGKKLLKSNQHQIDVSSFATGIYMVQIQTESGKIGVSKLVKK